MPRSTLPIHPSLTHPRTGAPLQAVGFRRNGTPIWPILGGDGTGDTGQPPAGQGQPSGQPAGGSSGQPGAGQGGQPPAGGQPTGQPGGDQQGKDGDVSTLPDWAQQVIRDARAEAGKARTNAKQAAADEARQQLVDEFAKVLGLKKGETDPAKLAEQLASTKTEARQRAVELAVYKTAGKHNANPDALLDSRTFLAKVADLDPSDKNFADTVESEIKDAVKNNTNLKASAGPARSGGEFPGGSGAGTPITEEQLKKMTPEQIDKALNEGKLTHLL